MKSLASSVSEIARIPRPLCAREGDVFEVIEFPTPPLNMASGALFVVLLGLEVDGWTHALEVDGSILMARLYFSSDGLMTRVEWLHEGEKDGLYPHRFLRILGAVPECYPTGDPRVRVIQYQEGMSYSPPYEYPYLVSKGPRA